MVCLAGASRRCQWLVAVRRRAFQTSQGVPGKLLRSPLTRALPQARDTSSRGPGRSRQAGLTRSDRGVRHRRYHRPPSQKHYLISKEVTAVVRSKLRRCWIVGKSRSGSKKSSVNYALPARPQAVTSNQLQSRVPQRHLPKASPLAPMRLELAQPSTAKRVSSTELRFPPPPAKTSTDKTSISKLTATPTVEEKWRTSEYGNDAALRRSVTALDGGSPPSGVYKNTPAAHSTAFQRSPSTTTTKTTNTRTKTRKNHKWSVTTQQPRAFLNLILALLLLVSLRLGPQMCLGDNSGGMKDKTSSRRHPYNEYSWELNQLNPWLSACDLAGPAPTDLQGSCGPPEVPKFCPSPCARQHDFDSVIAHREFVRKHVASAATRRKRRESHAGVRRTRTLTKQTTKNTAPVQCLYYLEESHKQDVCGEDFGKSEDRSWPSAWENRYWFLSGLRLRHCCEHAVANALAPGKGGPLEAVLRGGQACKAALDKLLVADALAARLHCELGEVLLRYDCSQTYSVIHNCTHCKVCFF